MNRTEFEALRDLPGKAIRRDIRCVQSRFLAPVLEADKIVIENSAGIELRMNLSFNPITGKKTVNVYVPGQGPICRLDVDGPKHGDAGRCHKHSLQNERCPERNLPDGALAYPNLSGANMRTVFDEFCRIAGIDFLGTFACS